LVEVMKGLRVVEIAKADGLDTEVYVLECDGGLILVDVGFTPQCLGSIQAELDEMGKTWGDVEMIIITHAHGDHIDNLPRVRELTGAEVVVGEGDEGRLYESTAMVTCAST
jgi:hydroxyacylglutathione hydrolase